MAQLNYTVLLIDATGLQVRTLEGSAAYDAFEVRSEELLKASMNQARKSFREAAPTRTGKMKRSFRVSRIRRKRDRETGGRIVIGYQVTTGRRQFYASITDRRQDTIVANWFNDVFEELTNSPGVSGVAERGSAIICRCYPHRIPGACKNYMAGEFY